MNAEPKETYEDRMARKQREAEEAREASLERILRLGRRTNISSPSTHPWKGGLHFEPSGAARLANIAGFIYGLTIQGKMTPLEQLAAVDKGTGNPRDLAIRLAVSIDEKLTYLAGYGGDAEIEVEAGTDGREAQHIKVPAYKVVLYDDGTFGGFGILWHRPYTTKQVQAKAREHDEAAYQGKNDDGSEMDPEEYHRRWDAALEAAQKGLRIRKELEDFRSWSPSWVKAKRLAYEAKHEAEGHEGYSYYSCKECNVGSYELSGSSEYVRYGFSHNGGLLLHGMGHPTFAVEISSDDGPRWSIHT
jgi:hypothetical protein